MYSPNSCVGFKIDFNDFTIVKHNDGIIWKTNGTRYHETNEISWYEQTFNVLYIRT